MMARANRLKADPDAMRTLQNQCLEEMRSLSEIITSSDDPFATAWVMLDMGLSLCDRVRRSFRLYLRWLESASVPLVVTENRSTILPMLREWGADHAGLLSVADAARLASEWFFFQADAAGAVGYQHDKVLRARSQGIQLMKFLARKPGVSMPG